MHHADFVIGTADWGTMSFLQLVGAAFTWIDPNGENNYNNDCDNPLTEEVETTCEEGGPSGGSGDSYSWTFPTYPEGQPVHGGSVYACYYTHWVEVAGGSRYEYDTFDGCYWEAVP